MDKATASIPDLLRRHRTRREALGWAIGASAAAVAANLTKRGTTRAQEATPQATPEMLDDQTGIPEYGLDDRTMYLFAQAFHEGSWRPGANDGEYLLELRGGLASTIYFSDRPQRVFGATDTQVFLDGLGFTPANPPNAAIVVNSDGEADILVIELFSPVYDAAEQVLTYTATVLGAYHESGLEYLAVQQADDSLAPDFGAGALFIDDCSDDIGMCGREEPNPWGRYVFIGGSDTRYGRCYQYGGCYPCRDYAPEACSWRPECRDGKCKFLWQNCINRTMDLGCTWEAYP